MYHISNSVISDAFSNKADSRPSSLSPENGDMVTQIDLLTLKKNMILMLYLLA